jgi:hypothetical protein
MKRKVKSLRWESSIPNQMEFIDNCEARGSYDGENGVAIRLADLQELRRRVRFMLNELTGLILS